MPLLDRRLAFLVFAVAFTATIPSAQAQRSILDAPLSNVEIVAKQSAFTRKLAGR